MTLKSVIVIFGLLIICHRGQGQSTAGMESTWKGKMPTYYTFGPITPRFVDTKKLYGFKTKHKKCQMKQRHIRHNNKVEKVINSRLGDNWFDENLDSLALGSQLP